VLAAALAVAAAATGASPAVAAAATGPSTAVATRTGPAPAVATANPTSNVTDSAAIETCALHGAASAACLSASVAAVDLGRAREHLPRLVLPADFVHLTVDRQLLTVVNSERSVRGLVAVAGTNATLDAAALAAARGDRDPDLASWTLDGHALSGWAANWAWGPGGVVLDDFLWVYDDGPGSPNLDCSATLRTGCWGHRHTVLAFDTGHLLLGGAAATTSRDGVHGVSVALLVADEA
jgi:hypothetical protein